MTAATVRAAILNEQGAAPDLAAVVAAIEGSGALDYARACARREADSARACLDALTPGVYRDALAELAEIAISRTG